MAGPLAQSRRFGWWSLLCWLALGLALESLHGFKVGWYLEVVNEGRRLQLTLAHSHGVLLALINLVFACSMQREAGPPALLARAGKCLRWSAVAMPLGFLGGGVLAVGADPGLPIVLVPIGGLLLFAGVLFAARAASASAT
ncbi:MAG TPA: hypothetical protein ENI87_07440 [bacterium]|nr:hypothetical protein [bacterium]